MKRRPRVPIADLLFFSAILILAALLRRSLIGFESVDYTHWVSLWYPSIKPSGIASLRAELPGYNYTPAYIYCIYVVTKLLPGLSPIATIKFVPIIFDFVCAYLGYLIVRLKYGKGSPFPFFAFCAILFAPSVMLNSAFWGQTDSLFTAGLLACVYFVLRRREAWAWAAFGLALAFKFQAVFLLPFLLALLLKGLLSWRRALLAPLVYVLSFVPAFILGRPVASAVTVYIDQANLYERLVMNAPNLYIWIPNDFYGWFYPAGMIFATAVVLAYIAAVYKSAARFEPHLLVQLALVSVLIVPFFTPKMHERYFFPADVLSIIYAFYFTRYFWVPVVMLLVSFFAYEPFLFRQGPFLMSGAALVLLLTIVILVWQMFTLLYPRPAPQTEAQREAMRVYQQ